MSLKTGSRWSNWAWDKPVKAFIWRSSRICRPIGGLPPWFFEDSLPHLLLRNNSIVGMMRHLGLDGLLASKPCQERQLVLAMIAERLLHPSSKLGTTRLWHTTTLAEELGGATANEDDLYAARDWLLTRQARIEQKLAKRH